MAPGKSALKKPPPIVRDRSYRDRGYDSGYGSSNEYVRSGTVTVTTAPLKPPGPSGTPPPASAVPLAEHDPNRSTRRGTSRPSHYPAPAHHQKPSGRPYTVEHVVYRAPAPSHPRPSAPPPTRPSAPPPTRPSAPPPTHPHPSAAPPPTHPRPSAAPPPTHEREGPRTRTMSEKLPENSTQGGLHVLITYPTPLANDRPITTAIRGANRDHHTYPNYGAIQDPRYAPQHPGQNPYTGGYTYPQAPPGRPKTLPRPAKYMPNAGGYSDTEGMTRQPTYPARQIYGSEVAPQDLHDPEQRQRLGLDERGFPIPGAHLLPYIPPHRPPPQPSNPTRGSSAIVIPDPMRATLTMLGFAPWTDPPLLRGCAPVTWPTYAYWYRQRGPEPIVLFDISQDPTDQIEGRGVRTLGRNNFGMSEPLRQEDANLPFSNHLQLRIIDLKCTAPELEAWSVVVRNPHGVRVIDVFEAIYKTYHVLLTPAELSQYSDLVKSEACQRALRRRCKIEHGLTEINEAQGMRRVDLVGDRTLFLSILPDEITRRYEFDLVKQDPDNICASQVALWHPRQ
ncbi:hypothetical protein C0991_008527 [Blastosporella zonata]|nr:hypothetical protein C0991_008527 [Blastosporella zonata]